MSTLKQNIGYRQIPVTMVIEGHEISHCILDTGAMTCSAPDALLREIGCEKVGTTQVGGAVGHTEVPVYEAFVGLKGLEGFGVEIEILGLPTSTALCGFNLIRHLDAINIDVDKRSVTFWANDKNAAHA
ncbi:MAG: hypothetical protein OXD01_04975 [Gammaproteobacteria bacterium]|nr:hypothetical protein [Gammaproteobacteria bacterium]